MGCGVYHGWGEASHSPSLIKARPTGRVSSFSMPSSSRYSLGPGLHRGHDVSERAQNNEMGTSVLIMRPILRFLQLLCENHNRDLQVSALPVPACPPLCIPDCYWARLAGTGVFRLAGVTVLCVPHPPRLCSAELPALSEQQDQLQPRV